MRLDRGQIEVLDDQMAEVLRAKSPAEPLAIANRLWWFVRRTISNALRSQHPDWDDERIEQETARRLAHDG